MIFDKRRQALSPELSLRASSDERAQALSPTISLRALNDERAQALKPPVSLRAPDQVLPSQTGGTASMSLITMGALTGGPPRRSILGRTP
jgi:hypothetical protein